MKEISVSLREWETKGPRDGAKSSALSGFRFDSEEERELARAFTKQRIVEFSELYDGLQISTRSHVGRIRIGRLSLTIRPKVAPDQLLALFRYAYGLKEIVRRDVVTYALQGELFQDLVIAQLYVETKRLVDRGIARAYVERRSNLQNPRGRIDFARLAAQGGVTSAELPCGFHERSSNHLLNQVVVSGLRLARGMAQDDGLSLSVGRLERLVSDFADHVPLSSALLQQAHRAVNRLVEPYRSILRLVEILYYGNLLSFDEETPARRLPGFLFDMNRFFQTLLQRFLQENLPEYVVEAEHGLTEMMRYVPGRNPKSRRSPRPRPDYAIKKGSKVIALLDAKYRDLWEKKLPNSMLYQLSVYALSQPRRSTAAILYPSESAAAQPAIIEIREPLSGNATGYVAQRPVYLPHLVALIQAPKVEPRQDYARALAGTRTWTMPPLGAAL